MIMPRCPGHCEESDVSGTREGLKWLELDRNRQLEWAGGDTWGTPAPGYGYLDTFFHIDAALPDIQD